MAKVAGPRTAREECVLNEKAGCLGKQGHVAEPAPASFFGAVGHQAPEDMSWTHLRGMRLSGWDLENSSPVCRFAMYHRPDTENGTWEISKTWFPLQAWRAPQKRRVVKPEFSMICWVGVRKLCWGHPAQGATQKEELREGIPRHDPKYDTESKGEARSQASLPPVKSPPGQNPAGMLGGGCSTTKRRGPWPGAPSLPRKHVALLVLMGTCSFSRA